MKCFLNIQGDISQRLLLVPFLEFTERAQNVHNFPFGCF